MLSCSCGENMKIRKTINLNDLILLEKVRMIYNEKYDGLKEKKILTEIYNILNNKFLKLELEDNKEINDFNIPIVIHTIDQNKRNYYMKEYKFDEYLEKTLKQAEEKKILLKLIK